MSSGYTPLPKKFYLRDTVTVSKELLGKLLVRKTGNTYLAGKITETEAYIGEHDPACHAFGRITPRNQTLYEDGGICYVYLIYGNYFCFNTVTEKKGEGSAVLIRAVEPIEGIEIMKSNRGNVKAPHDLTNGPGKLCLAMDIDKSLNAHDITKEGEIFIAKPLKKEKFEIVTTRRIGLNVGIDFPYRFFIKDNPYVTRHKFNKESL